MSSEEADHVSPWEVTPTVGKGTLGTWRFPTSAWVAGLIKPVQSPDAVLERAKVYLGAGDAKAPFAYP